jgi:hypothetical protein
MIRSALRLALSLLLLSCTAAASRAAEGGPLPVRGLHLMAPLPADFDTVLRLVREGLPKEGVNTLVLEINYRYAYTRHPEVIDKDALTREQLEALAEACRAGGIRLIPQINMLGHQSWDKKTFGLLAAHPELDETPGLYPDNAGIYCRSYCPRHPKVHEIVFDLIDELAEVTRADAVHVGMDEVFLLGEDACKRCKGRNKAELFADEVRALHDHLAKGGRQMWMWGDRFLDADVIGHVWEGAKNGTAPAIALVPKDIVICDWHYENVVPSAAHFALLGFPVVSSPWRLPGVALGQLDAIRSARRNSPAPLGSRFLGMLHTTWSESGKFARGYFGEGTVEPRVAETVLTFKELFRELRNGGLR